MKQSRSISETIGSKVSVSGTAGNLSGYPTKLSGRKASQAAEDKLRGSAIELIDAAGYQLPR